MSVELTIGVHRGQHPGWCGASRLWRKSWDTPYLPAVGEPVTLWITRGENSPYEGPTAPVKSRYWGVDGQALVELVGFQVDPNKSMRAHCDGLYRSRWDTDDDGDLDLGLRRGGWSDQWP